jgi:hypothetical protein
MGMDVLGKSPTNEIGQHFHNNVWRWRPLADYITDVAPELAKKCRHWHTNDGDGLSKSDAFALADRLQAELDSGRTDIYERAHAPYSTDYPFSTTNVREFVAFLRGCGRFEIW